MYNHLRNTGWWFSLMLLLQLLFASNLFGQDVLKARVDSVVMTIGDVNHLRVYLPSNMKAQVAWEVLEKVPAFSSLGTVTESAKGNEKVLSLPFSLYDSTQLMLPALPVYTQAETLFTNQVGIQVNFPKADSTSLAYRPIVKEPFSWNDYKVYGYVLIGLIVLAIVMYLLFRSKPKVIAEVTSPPPLPHEMAFKALSLLEQQTEWLDKQYYSELDRILRQYLWDRYQIPALERTNREITAIFEERDLPQKTELPQLLGQVDMVKFAKAKMPFEKRVASVASVRQFVELTKELPRIEVDQEENQNQ